jgi:hypothetical protein
MKKVLLVLAVAGISALCFGGSVKAKKDALERKYQRCMKYSRYKENCQKYRDIKDSIN